MVQRDWWHLGSAGTDTGSILDPAQRVKDPVLPQLWLRLQLRLRSDPWPGNSICCGAAKNGKKKKSRILYVVMGFFGCCCCFFQLNHSFNRRSRNNNQEMKKRVHLL